MSSTTAPDLAQSLLSDLQVEPLHDAWLSQRDEELRARLAQRPLGGRVVLLNATLGPQLYPSIVDFFALAQALHPALEVESVSYYDHIHEYGRGVAQKGVRTRSVDELLADALDDVDLVLAVGPSDALLELMARPELRPKLVLLDLGFYHQQIDATDRALLRWDYQRPGREEQVQRVTCWTCQPVTRIARVLDRLVAPALVTYRPLPYIPIGFRYISYVRVSEPRFDVALLGSMNRHVAQLDTTPLRGLRFVSLGASERDLDLERLAARVDLTVVPRVPEEVYAQLLASCRCVLLPLGKDVESVLLSAVDALGSGVPLVTKRCVGFERLEAAGAPMVLGDSHELPRLTADLLADEPRRAALAAASVGFARRHLDIFRMLETVGGRFLLPGQAAPA